MRRIGNLLLLVITLGWTPARAQIYVAEYHIQGSLIAVDDMHHGWGLEADVQAPLAFVADQGSSTWPAVGTISVTDPSGMTRTIVSLTVSDTPAGGWTVSGIGNGAQCWTVAQTETGYGSVSHGSCGLAAPVVHLTTLYGWIGKDVQLGVGA